MDTKELKKVLAGIGVVGLLAGGGIAVPGSAGASGWGGDKPSAVGTDKKPAAGSGWGGTKDDAVSVKEHVDEAKAKAGEAVDKAKSEMKKEPAGSGWGATKPDAGSVEDAKKAAPQKSGWSGWYISAVALFFFRKANCEYLTICLFFCLLADGSWIYRWNSVLNENNWFVRCVPGSSRQMSSSILPCEVFVEKYLEH